VRLGQAQNRSAMPTLCFKGRRLHGLNVVLQVSVPESDVSLLEPVNQSVGLQWKNCRVRQGRAQSRCAAPMLCFKGSEPCGLDWVSQVAVPESDVSEWVVAAALEAGSNRQEHLYESWPGNVLLWHGCVAVFSSQQCGGGQEVLRKMLRL